MRRYANGPVTDHPWVIESYTFMKTCEGRDEVTHEISHNVHPARLRPPREDSRFIDVMNAWGGSWSVRLAVCALTNGCLYITSRYSYSARSLFV